MTPQLTRSPLGLEPKAVVVAAYEAANRGRYQQADALLAPSFKRGLSSPGSAKYRSIVRADCFMLSKDDETPTPFAAASRCVRY